MKTIWKRLMAALLPGLMVLAADFGTAWAAAPDRVGYAYAPDTGRFLYSEAHFEVRRQGRLVNERVVYRAPDGTLLAEKRLDYRDRPFAPRFELSMTVNAYREGLRRTRDGLQTFYRPVGGGRTYTELLEESADLVADGGFDRVVADRLDALRNGRTLTFDFLVPGRLATYPFRVRRVGTSRILGEPALHLRMEPAGFLLRWLAEPIEVYYHRERGRLLRYIGPSNLRDPDGNNPRVRVDFPGRPPSPSELDRRAAAPSPFLPPTSRKD